MSMGCPDVSYVKESVQVGDKTWMALVDSGSSLNLVRQSAVSGWRRLMSRSRVKLITMSGATMWTEGMVTVTARTVAGYEFGPLELHVTKSLPGDVDLILGLPTMLQHGCCIAQRDGRLVVEWGAQPRSCLGGEHGTAKANGPAMVQDRDFKAEFRSGAWHVSWCWREGQRPPAGGVFNYKVQEEAQEGFDQEVAIWVREGILVPWNHGRHGPVKHRVPLMAVMQRKGDNNKVRPVMDFRRLNSRIESLPGGAIPTCRDKLREWRKKGSNCAVVDLRRAYLQVHVDESLWTYQAVTWHGQTYLLTRLGFGLSIAPKVMTAIVTKVLAQDEVVKNHTSAYIDDIFVDERGVSAQRVVDHLGQYGLASKPPVRLGDVGGARVLGLHVDPSLTWRRDKALPKVPEGRLTRRNVHALVGEWLGHFPVCGWLRVSCAYLQRCTAQEGLAWEESVSDGIREKVQKVDKKLREEGDPARGTWTVDAAGHAELWTDASSMALGVMLAVNGDVVEDAAWLRGQKDDAHINLAELDAAIKGINLAVAWGIRKFSLAMDSATVVGWLRSVIDRTHNVRTRALSELLIRRRLELLRQVIEQECLDITIRQVPTKDNRADELTRVPTTWGRGVPAAVAATEAPGWQQLQEVHRRHHFGVDRTLELAREKFGDQVSRRMVRRIVSRCAECARIDPAVREHWTKGQVRVEDTWSRLATDITHLRGVPWLTVVDCGSGLAIWRRLRTESAKEVRCALEETFATMGPPAELLSDNGTVFRSREVVELLTVWNVRQLLAGAYRPQGNGVVERVHRTIKRMVARTQRSVAECVFWLNSTKGGREYSPFEAMFAAKPRLPGVRPDRIEVQRGPRLEPLLQVQREDEEHNPFVVSDRVYLRPPSGKCNETWTGPHQVTAVRSRVLVELDDDGVARHISHVRRVPVALDTERE